MRHARRAKVGRPGGHDRHVTGELRTTTCAEGGSKAREEHAIGEPGGARDRRAEDGGARGRWV